MKKNVIFWKTSDRERRKEVKEALGITSITVNGESDYNGDPERLVPYVEEGLIVIRTKEYEERRVKEAHFDTKQSKSYNRQEIGRSCRKRKI